MKPTFAWVIVSLLNCPGMAAANNAQCWGFGVDDPDRYDISCTPLTEHFLLSMRGASRNEVLKEMNAKGREISENSLHFISNYAMGRKGHTGLVNFEFTGEIVSGIYADVDSNENASGNIEFIWNEETFCSDFPDSKKVCDK